MRYIFLFVINLLICVCAYGQESIVVRGRVFDKESNEELQGAGVEYLRKRTITNSNGEFIAYLLKGEIITFKISFMGYDSCRVSFKANSDTIVSIPMSHNNTIADATITASKNHMKVFHKISAIGFDKSTLFSIPTALGEVDIMKAIQKLPGVVAVGDGRASLSVRGGKMDQNQILLNGITLYNAEHMKGFVTSINPYMADSLFFYKGGFPAQYGGHLSSIICTEINDGDYHTYHGALSLGVISSTFHLNGPIWKGKTSFNVGARFSYLDFILLPTFKSITKNESYTHYFTGLQYYDVTAILSHKFSSKDRVSATFYYSNDNQSDTPPLSNVEIIKNKDSSTKVRVVKNLDQSYKISWNNIAGGLLWEHYAYNNTKLDTRLNFSSYYNSYNDYKSITETTTFIDDGKLNSSNEETYTSDLASSLMDVSLSSNLSRTINNHFINFGVKYSLNQYKPYIGVDYFYDNIVLNGDRYITLKHSDIDTIIGKNYLLNIGTIYMEDTWRFNHAFLARLGLRYSLVNVNKALYHSFEPRATIIYYPSKSMDLELSYAKMSQSSHFLTSSNIVSPNDMWVPITETIPLMTSDIVSSAYRLTFDKGWSFSLEGYYKWMKNLIEYKEGIFVANTLRNWDSLVNVGDGEAYGIEVLVERNMGSTTGWASYTWSKSIRMFDSLNGGKPFYSLDDRRHNFNIAIKQVFNKMFDMTLSWYYQTGKRGTIPQYAYISGSSWEEINPFTSVTSSSGSTTSYPFVDRVALIYALHSGYQERNSYKFPDSHRLDLSLNIRLEHNKCSSQINISLYNIYNQPNVSSAYLDFENDRVVLKGITLLPFIPSINYSLLF